MSLSGPFIQKQMNCLVYLLENRTFQALMAHSISSKKLGKQQQKSLHFTLKNKHDSFDAFTWHPGFCITSVWGWQLLPYTTRWCKSGTFLWGILVHGSLDFQKQSDVLQLTQMCFPELLAMGIYCADIPRVPRPPWWIQDTEKIDRGWDEFPVE